MGASSRRTSRSRARSRTSRTRRHRSRQRLAPSFFRWNVRASVVEVVVAVGGELPRDDLPLEPADHVGEAAHRQGLRAHRTRGRRGLLAQLAAQQRQCRERVRRPLPGRLPLRGRPEVVGRLHERTAEGGVGRRCGRRRILLPGALRVEATSLNRPPSISRGRKRSTIAPVTEATAETEATEAELLVELREIRSRLDRLEGR